MSTFEEITKETYDVAAKIWPTIRQSSWEFTQAFLEDVEDKQTLADIGCGAGRDLQAAVDAGFDQKKCIGIDVSQGQLAQTQKLGFQTKQGSLIDLPLEDNSQNTLLCIAAFHHLLNKKTQLEGAQELYRVCNQDGQLLLSYWFVSEEYKDNNKQKLEMISDKVAKVLIDVDGTKYERYYYVFDEQEINDLFTQVGFTLVSLSQEQSNVFFVFEK